jgi:hypothetical protein
MLYAFPDVGRFGLAHSLLAWARARVWARRHGATPIAPNWLRMRIGPYLRRERDKRNYFLLFSSGNAISGLRKRILLLTHPRIDERRLVGGAAPTSGIIVFRSIPDNDIRADFGALRGEADFLHAELLAMTRPRYRPDRHHRPHAAVHVRLGDFAEATPEQLAAGIQNIRLPLSWYRDVVETLRRALGETLPICLYSDGSDAELGLLLSMPHVTRSTARAAISDMLSIADATVLVGSGSGFSLWGSYLGQVPRISYPGQGLVSVLDDSDQEIALAPGQPLPAEFQAHLVTRIARQHGGKAG